MAQAAEEEQHYHRSLAQFFDDKLRLREDHRHRLFSLPELPDGSGYMLDDATTRRVVTSADADVAVSLIRTHGEIMPAHLWIMAQKAVPAHIVYRDGREVAAAMGYMRIAMNNLVVGITYTTGSPDAIMIAKKAIACDAYKRGIDVEWLNQVFQRSYPLKELRMLQHVQRKLFPPETLGFDEQTDAMVFSSRLTDGAQVIVRPPTEVDYMGIEAVEQRAFKLGGSDQAAVDNFFVRRQDLRKLNRPEHTMLIAEVDGQIVAFVFGFLGMKDRKLVLYSHLAGTVPEFQSRGVMRVLKRAQVIAAARLGCSELRWTYDPAFDMTQSNHWFNIVELGCAVDTYMPDVYPRNLQRVGRYAVDGEEEPRPTDRFEVVQRITDRAFRDHLKGIQRKHPYTIDEARQLPVATDTSAEPLLRFPLRRPEESATLYLKTMRSIIPSLFKGGYEIVSVASDYKKGVGVTEAWFVLEKQAGIAP